MTDHSYICDDGNAEVAITAETAYDAASEYVRTGDWGTGTLTETTWVRVYVQRDVSDIEERLVELIGDRDYSPHDTGWWVYDADDLDIELLGEMLLGECSLIIDESGDLCVDHDHDRESHTIAIDPPEPECCAAEHDWQSPHELLGGAKENPGVWGHGGGVIIRDCCADCGAYRVRDTWAQDPATGEQGLESLRYEDADESSATWVARRKLEAAMDDMGDVQDYCTTEDGYTVTLTDEAIGRDDQDLTDQEARDAAWRRAIDAVERLEGRMPNVPADVDIELDDDEMDVVHIRITS